MNSENLHIEDFTRVMYARFLSVAKEKYAFTFFDNFFETENSILLRHDVDISITSALALADIENEYDIKSTYLFNLRSEFYNVLSPDDVKKIRRINSLGHKIGLHFDATTITCRTIEELNDYISLEKSILEKYLEVPIKSMSFHNPTLGNADFYTHHEYCGMVNSYSNKWKTAKYNSDSNGYWRHDRLFDLIDKKAFSHFQVLIHPEYWIDSPMLPIERISKWIRSEAEDKIRDYISFLELNGRKPAMRNQSPTGTPKSGINQPLS